MDVFHNLLESSLVNFVVGRLLLNYIVQPCIPFNNASYSVFSGRSQPGVLQRVSFAAPMMFLLELPFI